MSYVSVQPTDVSQVRKYLTDNSAITPETAIKVTGLLGELALEGAKRSPYVKVTEDDRFYWDQKLHRRDMYIIIGSIGIFVVVIVLLAISSM